MPFKPGQLIKLISTDGGYAQVALHYGEPFTIVYDSATYYFDDKFIYLKYIFYQSYDSPLLFLKHKKINIQLVNGKVKRVERMLVLYGEKIFIVNENVDGKYYKFIGVKE